MDSIRISVEGAHAAARSLILTALGVSLVAATPAVQRASISSKLCGPGEQVLFQCAVGPKLAAACGIRGGAVYRFGRPARVELALRTLTRASRGYSGGGETQITATNNNYTYTLFDRVTRTSFDPEGRHDAAITSGLLVRRAGRTVLVRACSDEPTVSSRLTEQLIPQGPFVEHR